MSDDMDLKLHLLESITNNFSEDHRVGRGGFGDVYKGVYKGKEIAVKKLHQLQGLDDRQFDNEFRNLSKVHHQNVVKLVGYCYELRKKYVPLGGQLILATIMERILCFEYMHGGSLQDHIKDDSCDLDWPTCYQIIKGICEGINHLHTAYGKPILHLDIKPANILLDKNKNAKIADLGLSRMATTKTLVTNTVRGTQGYMPPEFVLRGRITTKFDVYSLGVLIIQLMDGNIGRARSTDMSPESFIEHVDSKWKNKRLKEMPWHPLHEIETLQVKKCIEIALRCILEDGNQRPSAKEVVDELQQFEAEIEKLSRAPNDQCKDLLLQGLSSSSSASFNISSGKLSFLPFSDKFHSSTSGPGHLDVVIVYAFDCTDWTSAWYTVDDGVFWMVQEKLGHYMDSCMGYIYYMVDGNTYTSDMKLVDPAETKATGYTSFARRRLACTKNMASGLDDAHKMISNRGYKNGIILLFSDGLIHRGDFFDGAENFVSEVPVHTFTLGGAEYNQGLHTIAANSRGGKFHTIPVPERPMLSERFSLLLDSIFEGTTFQDENPPIPSPENQPLDVVIVYAFDCTDSTLAWSKVDGTIFWMVQEKLRRLANNSCMGYIYPMLTKNTYTSDMKIVDSAETKATGYTSFARRRITCTKKMASGLPEAHKMISNRGYQNGIILFFSDGFINKGDFFDGTENFTSQFPVHTFTLGGGAYTHVLQAIADKSPHGTFNATPVPDRPELSTTFSELLDSLLKSSKVD